MHIRPPTTGDAGHIASLAVELGYLCDAELVRSRLAGLSTAPTQFVAVADGDGALLGWIHAEHRIVLESDDRAELVGLVVSEGVRRTDVGRALVRAAENWAAARGLTMILVRADMERPEPHSFYEEVGYVRTQTQHVYSKRL
jgi:GNAT superfamily N-acetyltransferase